VIKLNIVKLIRWNYWTNQL